MIKAVVFGGTTEGRKLCETGAEYAIPIRYCVATADGARPVDNLQDVNIHIGRLRTAEMVSLIRRDSPALVFDATHPYAAEASQTIAAACQSVGIPLLRVLRENVEEQGCTYFSDMDDLLAWLEREPGDIFVTTGASNAGLFTKLQDFQNRVWLRILPSLESLRSCLEWGYRPERLICMQGPFSEELNSAMFNAAKARILVTKNAGAAGGFPEKVRAARSLDMVTAVLAKPSESGGVSLENALLKMMELRE
ncbi:MAG: precorrin-6A reductase [Clostridiales bacterium]|nr:precorrin-6A reductase [Clostridiales bacterium]